MLPALASAVENGVHGRMHSPLVEFRDGANIMGPGVDAILIDSTTGDVAYEVTWSLTAERSLVNWTNTTALGVGEAKSDANRSFYAHEQGSASGERNHWLPSLTSKSRDPQGNLLILTEGFPGISEIRTWEDAIFSTAESEEWWIGTFSNKTRSTDPNHPTTYQYVLPDGQPVIRTKNGTLVLEGNFSLHVWGGDVVVDEPNRHRTTYRSGTWWTDPVAPVLSPKGVARQEHHQLLRIEATNATLRLTQHAGIAQWTGPSVTVSTNGTARIHDAIGTLTSATGDYLFHRDDVRLEGDLHFNCSNLTADVTRLHCRVDATGAQVNHPPDVIKEPGPLVPDTSRNENATAEAVTTLDRHDDHEVLMLLFTPFAVVAAAVGALVLRHRTVNGPPDEYLARAEAALVRRRPGKARRFARRALRAGGRPTNPWFVFGASLLQQGRNRTATRRLRRALDDHGDAIQRPPIAFLLAVCYLRLDDRREAARWAEIAGQDPGLRERMVKHGNFGPILQVSPMDGQAPAVNYDTYAYA